MQSWRQKSLLENKKRCNEKRSIYEEEVTDEPTCESNGTLSLICECFKEYTFEIPSSHEIEMVEKKDDWFSEEADRTRKLFKVRKSWKLEVKDDVFLVDSEDPYTVYSVPQWVFVVMDWEEYALYEDELYWENDYNNSFNLQPIEDGVDKDN